MKLQRTFKNLTFTLQPAFGNKKYFHVMLLAFSFGRNGFMLSILGASFSIAWKQKTEHTPELIKWIEVGDILPNFDDPVLVIDKWGYMSVCGYGTSEQWYPKLSGSYPNFNSSTITHWTELPPPPVV